MISFYFPLEQCFALDANDTSLQRYRVLQTSTIPNPKNALYPDCLTHILCQPITETGTPSGDIVDLVFYAFRKRVIYPAAKLKSKDEVSLRTISFHKTDQEIQNLKQVNDLPFSGAQILFVSQWKQQDIFITPLSSTEHPQVTPTSNRDLIIQTLLAHQGKVTGGVNRDFFFWSHVPAMYESDFWKIQPSKKNALGPLKSILLFKNHLAEKNINLIFMPIPRSTTIYPGIATNIEYTPSIDGRINFAVRDLMDALEAEGVTCVDLTPTFLANAFQQHDGKSYPIYRRNDTHWAPSGVRLAAKLIADTIITRPAYSALNSTVLDSHLTETVTLEEFPYTMPVFDRPPSRRQPKETLPSYTVDGRSDADRRLLNNNLPAAEIHLLGDSFCNAYGSGAGQAGLHPHLVKALKTPINKIASASGGSAISPNQFARQADLSKAKIVIWAVCESFLAAPDIWADTPLDRPDTLMLDKLLTRAKPSHDIFTFQLASQKTTGSYIALGNPSTPDKLPAESRILWENVRINDDAQLTSFTVSTWIQNNSTTPTLPPLESYPLSWELWINGSLYKTQNNSLDRGIFQQQKWKVKLKKFAGQTLDFELVCRRTNSEQKLPGQACWILPEIHGAKLVKAKPHRSVSESQAETTPAIENSIPASDSEKTALPHTRIAFIVFGALLVGVITSLVLRSSRKSHE
ncbi:MAG: hypothetical protein GXP30_08090 [Verrucomicrobia bacterium]|nr:hypothetical protein [Verrucomicrobiota bacterium]